MDKLKVLIKKLGYLNIMMNKCVSTIPDECKGVGLEIGTNPKRKAIYYINRTYSQCQW